MWPSLIASASAVAVSFLAPLASFAVMRISNDPRTITAQDPFTFGLMDLHVQLITVFSSLVALVATAITFSVTSEDRFVRPTGIAVTIAASGWLLWLFAAGGAAQVPVDLYVPRPGEVYGPGVLRIPPFDSGLTQTRGGVILATLLLVASGQVGPFVRWARRSASGSPEREVRRTP